MSKTALYSVRDHITLTARWIIDAPPYCSFIDISPEVWALGKSTLLHYLRTLQQQIQKEHIFPIVTGVKGGYICAEWHVKPVPGISDREAIDVYCFKLFPIFDECIQKCLPKPK